MEWSREPNEGGHVAIRAERVSSEGSTHAKTLRQEYTFSFKRKQGSWEDSGWGRNGRQVTRESRARSCRTSHSVARTWDFIPNSVGNWLRILGRDITSSDFKDPYVSKLSS